jgi:hypothetical protein
LRPTPGMSCRRHYGQQSTPPISASPGSKLAVRQPSQETNRRQPRPGRDPRHRQGRYLRYPSGQPAAGSTI